jgi:hypothetical protein
LTDEETAALAAIEEAKGDLTPALMTHHRGFLYKRGGNNTDWKKRWFVFDAGVLSYFRSDVDREAAGHVPLDQIISVASRTALTDSYKCFDVRVAGGRVYQLGTETEEDRTAWINLLRSNLDALPQDARAVSLQACSKTGYLEKRGEINPAFRRRYFGLCNRELYYFRSREDPMPAGSIDLRTVTEVNEGVAPVRVCKITKLGPTAHFLCACIYSQALNEKRPAAVLPQTEDGVGFLFYLVSP